MKLIRSIQIIFSNKLFTILKLSKFMLLFGFDVILKVALISFSKAQNKKYNFHNYSPYSKEYYCSTMYFLVYLSDRTKFNSFLKEFVFL